MDGSTLWDKLYDLKKSHPVHRAEFIVAQNIDCKPAVNWWVKHVLRKSDRIVASIRKQQTRYQKKSHKFGIELPMTLEQALALDAKNGNTLWADAITKELQYVNIKLRFYQMERKQP